MDIFYKTSYNSPVGLLTLCVCNDKLVGAWLEGQKYFFGDIKGEVIVKDNLPVLNATKAWLDDYFAGRRPNIDLLSLLPIGNEFRKMVWQELCRIPYGEVRTYGEIASKIAKIKNIERMSAQAVGGAIGHNPIAIIIPCHRAIGKNGKLTGYAGGIGVKQWLLEFEVNGAKNYTLHF